MKYAETPSTPQEVLYNNGVDIAWDANDAHDALAQSVERARVAIAGMSKPPTAEETEEYLNAVKGYKESLSQYAALSNAVGSLIGRHVELEPAADDTVDTTGVEAWLLLSPEQQEKADRSAEAMAAKFGVDEADFEVFRYQDEAGADRFTLVYAAEAGISFSDGPEDYPTEFDGKQKRESAKIKPGSWRDIMHDFSARADRFMINVDGEKFDTREGMTRPIYEAMIEEAHALGEVVPDSYDASQHTGGTWTSTLLTGEIPPNGWHAPMADVDAQGRVRVRLMDANSNADSVRFRPTMPIE